MCPNFSYHSTLRFASWKDRKTVDKDLKSVYTALSEEDGQIALTEFNDLWEKNIRILQFLGLNTRMS